jgi:DNA repair protein RadD
MMEYRYYQREAISSIAQYLYKTPAGFHPLVAMPTGTGKSLVITGFIYEFLMMYPNLRFLCLTHVKELVKQNAATMRNHWEYAPIGIYSAGLKQRDTALPIIFGGVASVVKNIHAFGWRDFIIIDEAHLVSDDEGAMYAQIIAEVLKVNPACRVIGLTATAFRSKSGELAGNGGIFTDVCFDITTPEWFNRLIAEGYLSPLIARPTKTQFDMSGVKTIGDDYAKGEAERAVDKDEITRQCLIETCDYGENRRKWLIFTQGVNHAEHVNDMLNSFGVSSVVVHSRMDSKERDKRLTSHRTGAVRCIVNFGVLTTGYDDPEIDLISMMRSTKSPGLWVQMLGRGTRPSPMTGKNNCLCLDFGNNTPRLGQINDPVVPKNKKKGTGGAGMAPIKICSNCGNYCHSSVRFCEWCANEFLQQVKLTAVAGDAPLISIEGGHLPIIETYTVQRTWFSKTERVNGKTPYLKCVYYVENSLVPFTERVLLEHDGMAKHIAHDWWRKRHSSQPPETVNDALQYIDKLKPPQRIKVWVNKLYNGKPTPEVVGHEF